MSKNIAILNRSIQQDVLLDQLEVLAQMERSIPNSVQYDMRRYAKLPGWQVDDIGMMEYNYAGKNNPGNTIRFKFCVQGKTACFKESCNTNGCHGSVQELCEDERETVDVYSITFTASYLRQFLTSKAAISEAEKFLSFKNNQSITSLIPLCNKNRHILQSLFNHRYTDVMANIFINSQLQFLLVYSLDCLFGEGDRDKVYQCKFLEDARGRETITKARELLLQHIGDPITIKDLARKVATNECYLKKGFKEMFGMTIFEFYQGQRMEHAKFLLYEKGLSVTDVSSLLGYSSISHFSTAFKKHTGLKPCDLLSKTVALA